MSALVATLRVRGRVVSGLVAGGRLVRALLLRRRVLRLVLRGRVTVGRLEILPHQRAADAVLHDLRVALGVAGADRLARGVDGLAMRRAVAGARLFAVGLGRVAARAGRLVARAA